MSYVWAGYVAVFVTLVLYAVWVLARGRRLSRLLPPEERRWL